MLARLQQLITLSLFVAALVWLVWCVQGGQVAIGIAGASLVVFAYACVLAVEFGLLWFVHGEDPAPRATPLELLQAWWGEVLMGPLVFYWRQPFRAGAFSDVLSSELRGKRGVLLVHGFVCNRGFWNPWLTQLRAASIPHTAINLEPVFGSIDSYVQKVEQGICTLEAITGLPPVVVAHSMGGLAVRAWMRDMRAADARVHRVITIGSPHHGTWLGRFAHTPNTRQMALNSPWIRSLAAQEPAERYQYFTCFYSNCDNIAFPPSSATLPGADNRHLAGWSHVHLAFHPVVFDELMRWLEPLPAAPRAASDPVRCFRKAP